MTRKEILEKTIDFDDAINRIVRLEEENAELKEKYVKNIIDCDICDTYCNSQLTKAKEIIKYLLSFIQKENYKTRWDINITEAEQFISEEKK